MKIKELRHVLSIAVAASTLATAGLAASFAAPVSAQTAAACTTAGGMSFTPPLTQIPRPTFFSGSGTINCSGFMTGAAQVLQGGTFAMSGTCNWGSITVIFLCSFDLSGFVAGSSFGCLGTLLLGAGIYEGWHCAASPVTYSHWGEWLPSPVIQFPISNVLFQGVDALSGL